MPREFFPQLCESIAKGLFAQLFPDGSFYVGEMQDGLPHGVGFLCGRLIRAQGFFKEGVLLSGRIDYAPGVYFVGELTPKDWTGQGEFLCGELHCGNIVVNAEWKAGQMQRGHVLCNDKITEIQWKTAGMDDRPLSFRFDDELLVISARGNEVSYSSCDAQGNMHGQATIVHRAHCVTKKTFVKGSERESFLCEDLATNIWAARSRDIASFSGPLGAVIELQRHRLSVYFPILNSHLILSDPFQPFISIEKNHLSGIYTDTTTMIKTKISNFGEIRNLVSSAEQFCFSNFFNHIAKEDGGLQSLITHMQNEEFREELLKQYCLKRELEENSISSDEETNEYISEARKTIEISSSFNIVKHFIPSKVDKLSDQTNSIDGLEDFCHFLESSQKLKVNNNHSICLSVYKFSIFCNSQTKLDIQRGIFLSDQMRGFGAMTLQNGQTHIGFFKNNKPYGKGKRIKFKGAILESLWKDENSEGAIILTSKIKSEFDIGFYINDKFVKASSKLIENTPFIGIEDEKGCLQGEAQLIFDNYQIVCRAIDSSIAYDYPAIILNKNGEEICRGNFFCRGKTVLLETVDFFYSLNFFKAKIEKLQ